MKVQCLGVSTGERISMRWGQVELVTQRSGKFLFLCFPAMELSKNGLLMHRRFTVGRFFSWFCFYFVGSRNAIVWCSVRLLGRSSALWRG